MKLFRKRLELLWVDLLANNDFAFYKPTDTDLALSSRLQRQWQPDDERASS